MEHIMSVFQPFADALTNVDYLWSDKWDMWVWIRRGPGGEEEIRLMGTPKSLLCSLVGDFFDQAEGKTASEAVEAALEALHPYLAQLPPDQAEYAETALRVYVKLDESPASL